MILDTRAATYSRLGRAKEALKDAKKTIEVAPERWQGYGRAAQLFFDVKKVDASITMVQLALSKLTEKDTERRASLLALEAKALKAQADIERHRRRFSDHMANLPIELFGMIASMVVENNHKAVINLSQVSKHWRHVVHNSPYLWDVLVLNSRRPKQKAKLWLERSNGKLYELTILSGAIENWPDGWLKGLRWEELHIFKFYSSDFEGCLASIRDSGSVLGHLEQLDVAHSTSWETILPPNTSSLRDLALRHTTLSPNSFLGVAPHINNLRALTLEEVRFSSETAFSELLEAAASVEVLLLYGIKARLSNDLALLHLTHLDIRGMSALSLPLSNLPELRILRLEGGFIADQFLGVVEKTSPYLTEFALRSCVVSPAFVIAVLAKSRELQTLEICNSEASQVAEFLAATDPFPSSESKNSSVLPTLPSVRCPNLTRINFSQCDDVQTGPIVRMIKARLPPSTAVDSPGTTALQPLLAPIRKITTLIIDECPNVDSAWLPWIRQNVRSVSCVYNKKRTKTNLLNRRRGG